MAGFTPRFVLSKYNPVQTLYSRFTIAGKTTSEIVGGAAVCVGFFPDQRNPHYFYQFNFLTAKAWDTTIKILWKLRSDINRNEAAVMKRNRWKDPSIQDVTFKNGGSWGTIAR